MFLRISYIIIGLDQSASVKACLRIGCINTVTLRKIKSQRLGGQSFALDTSVNLTYFMWRMISFTTLGEVCYACEMVL